MKNSGNQLKYSLFQNVSHKKHFGNTNLSYYISVTTNEYRRQEQLDLYNPILSDKTFSFQNKATQQAKRRRKLTK